LGFGVGVSGSGARVSGLANAGQVCRRSLTRVRGAGVQHRERARRDLVQRPVSDRQLRLFRGKPLVSRQARAACIVPLLRRRRCVPISTLDARKERLTETEKRILTQDAWGLWSRVEGSACTAARARERETERANGLGGCCEVPLAVRGEEWGCSAQELRGDAGADVCQGRRDCQRLRALRPGRLL
jgi:hypothetical protein